MSTPDPQTVREIARDCVADYIDDARDIADHVMGHFGMGVPGDVYAWTDAVRTDLRAAVVSWPDEQPQDERNPCGAQLPADSAQRLGASPDTRCARPDGHTAHDDGNGVLWIDRERAAQDERDGDARAVADFLASDKLGPAMAALHDHFAARIAVIGARDAKGGEQR